MLETNFSRLRNSEREVPESVLRKRGKRTPPALQGGVCGRAENDDCPASQKDVSDPVVHNEG